MATIVTLVTLLVTAYLLQGAATDAQATTEELLTELDKPSEYHFFVQTSDVSCLLCKNRVSVYHVNGSVFGTSIYLRQKIISFKMCQVQTKNNK